MKNIFKTLFFVIATFFVFDVNAGGHEPSPEQIEGAETVSPTQAKDLFDREVLFIDARDAASYKRGHIPGAVNMPFKEGKFTEEALKGLAKDKSKEFVIYCNGEFCSRAPGATKKAVEWGYTNVKYFRLGFPGWEKEGYPVQ